MFSWITPDTIGAAFVLLSFTKVVQKRWEPDSFQALLTNIFGSGILLGVGIAADLPGMVILNIVWIGVAFKALVGRAVDAGVFDTREKLIEQQRQQDILYHERLRAAGLDRGE